MKNIIVLGSGMVGSTMAIDLSNQFNVTISDIQTETLKKIKSENPKLNIIQLDVTNEKALIQEIQLYDLVVCAVPGFLGFQTLKSIIKAKKDVVDISFFPENALELNELAIKNKVTAIVDCGVAPGMSNLILGYYNEILNITDFECMVGGLPLIKNWPFNYKAPFSPIDVIEEYTRPARYVENGEIVTREALSDVELVQIDKVGTLESFNSDGLRSILYTMPHIKNMKEKTLRYPGHVEYIQVLKQSGFFNEEPINIKGNLISPIEFTNQLLFKEWKLEEKEPEITVMKIVIKGTDKLNNQQKEIVYNLYDQYDPISKKSSMARTTGYTATAAANLITSGLFDKKGVFPPELIGNNPQCFDSILKYLKERNVIYSKTEKFLNE